MKVIVTSPSFGKFHTNIIRNMELEGCKVVTLIPYSKERMLEEVIDADAIIVGLEKIDEEIIDRGRNLKMVAKHGVGVDNIDLEAATKAGVLVANSPGTNNDAVADLAFGLVLSLARSIPVANIQVKSGQWPRYDGRSVWEKTIGIIGLGAIGVGVAKRASGFSMNILGYDITEPSAEENELNIKRVTLEEMLEQSDYISLHVPLNQHTENMIAAEAFDLMKDTAFLVNTARGGLIDEQALFKALKENKINGCALDVFEVEPPEKGSIPDLDNLIVTPHMAAYTVEAGYLTSEVTMNNVLRLKQEKELINIVNN